MSVEDDIAYYEREAAEEAFIDQTLKDLSEGPTINYLGTYGDAITKRIRSCQEQAKALHNDSFFGPSLTLSITAIELAIRFLLLHPLIQGAFLSEEWSDILTTRILQGRTVDDHKLLTKILIQWKVDIQNLKLKSGRSFQESLSIVRKQRNLFVHRGDPVNSSHSEIGIEIIDMLFDNVIFPISNQLGFTLEKTGKWHNSVTETFTRSYKPENPFEES